MQSKYIDTIQTNKQASAASCFNQYTRKDDLSQKIIQNKAYYTRPLAGYYTFSNINEDKMISLLNFLDHCFRFTHYYAFRIFLFPNASVVF